MEPEESDPEGEPVMVDVATTWEWSGGRQIKNYTFFIIAPW